MRLASTLVLGIFFLPGEAQAQSAAEKADTRLAALLEPATKLDAGQVVSSPAVQIIGGAAPLPDLASPKANVAPPAPPKPVVKPAEPRPPQEETPLVRSYTSPVLPELVVLPTQPLARVFTFDLSGPTPLPILSLAVLDRAPLADPAFEASVAATLNKLEPARTQPVPFQAQNLPDPFEHVDAMRLRVPVDETPTPPLAAVAPTRR